jgi:polyhydroxyalkanoate synthesis regulator phasin
MNDKVKKALLFGIGSIYYTKDKIEDFIKDLEKENITPEEGKKLVEEFMTKASKFKTEQESEVKKVVKQTLEELGVATKKDIDALKKHFSGAKQTEEQE